MIKIDDYDEAVRAAAQYQLELDRDPTLAGKWRIEASGEDPINQNFVLKAYPLWGHGWTLPDCLNFPFPQRKRKK